MELDAFITEAIKEDIGDGDHTTSACIPKDAKGRMYMLVKEPGVIAGLDVARHVFHRFDEGIIVHPELEDGVQVAYGDIPMRVEGPVHSLLKAERLVLNIAQRMSGIATKTAEMNELIQGTTARLLDTRKTTPNFRWFEKEAVRIGGGVNHRMGLYDAMMVKDNHIDFAGGITAAIDRCNAYQKEYGLDLDVIVEARDMAEVSEILEHREGVRRILLDNFSPEQTKEAVVFIDGCVETESSGGISEVNVRDYAECGVDYISIGALTHRFKSMDISLKADFDVG